MSCSSPLVGEGDRGEAEHSPSGQSAAPAVVVGSLTVDTGAPAWGWYASPDGETFTTGPEPTRDAIIAAAIEEGFQRFTIIEAHKKLIEIAPQFLADDFLERANESIWEDHGDRGDPGQDMLADVTPEDEANLQARVRATIAQWQADRNIVIEPFRFTETRNREDVHTGQHDVLAHIKPKSKRKAAAR